MDGHEFHLLPCKYFSTVTVLLYLPHLFVCIYFVIWDGLISGDGDGDGEQRHIYLFSLYL